MKTLTAFFLLFFTNAAVSHSIEIGRCHVELPNNSKELSDSFYTLKSNNEKLEKMNSIHTGEFSCMFLHEVFRNEFGFQDVEVYSFGELFLVSYYLASDGAEFLVNQVCLVSKTSQMSFTNISKNTVVEMAQSCGSTLVPSTLEELEQYLNPRSSQITL